MKKIYAVLLFTGMLTFVSYGQQTGGCPVITSTQSPSVCAGESFAVGTHIYTTSNSYIDTLSSSISGCDSIVTTNLTVKPPMVIDVNTVIPTCGCGGPMGLYAYYGAAGPISYQWIDCDNNGAIISGATEWEILLGQPPVNDTEGNFAVIITDGGCVDTSACYYVIMTGISEQEELINGLNIYPNPATDHVTISFNNPAEAMLNLSLMNVLGASVYDSGKAMYAVGENSSSFSTANISNGVYMLRISDGNSMVTKRIVVSH